MKSQGKITRKQEPNLRPKKELFTIEPVILTVPIFWTISSFFASRRKTLTLTLFLKQFFKKRFQENLSLTV